MSSTKQKPRKATKDHLRKRSKAATTIVLYTDEEASARVIDLGRQLDQLKMVDPEGAKTQELATELEEATSVRDESAVSLRFEAIGRKKYNALVDEHPPTEAQVAEWVEHQKAVGGDPDSTPQYNPETFPSALMHATLVAPEFDGPEELEEALEDWSETEYMQLWMAAMSVCAASRVAHWGKG